MLLFRYPHLARNIEKHARYIVRPGTYHLGRRSLEGSRPGMALLLHAALNLIGARGYEILVDEGVRKARYLAREVSARSEFELLVRRQSNIVVCRYLPEPFRAERVRRALSYRDQEAINQANENLQRRQRRAGRTFVSRTTLDQTRYGNTPSLVGLRAVLANPVW